MIDLGFVRPGRTVRIPFSSFDKDDGSSITMTNYAAADILVYKDGSATQRASTAGFTATTDFDSGDAGVGKHLAVIDLADNTTAGFWAAGSEYLVAIGAVTIDGVTTGGWIARFRIGYPNAVLDTTIATLASQTSFTLTVGPAEDDALNGMWAMIHDVASAVQAAWVEILDYTGSTKTVTLAAGATFTVAATDNISVMAPSPLRPLVTGRLFGVESGGKATGVVLADTVTTYTGNTPQTGDNFARIGAPTGASIAADIQTRATPAQIAAGAVASVTGAVGSVTGNVGGNVAGSVGSVTAGVTLAAGAVQAIWDALTSALTTAGSIGKRIADFLTGDAFVRLGAPAGASVSADIATKLPTSGYTAPPSASDISDQVWDEAIAGHLGAGSTGASLNGAGSAGDPWGTALPGAYGAGTAGKIVGDNINATVSSRATQTSVDTIDDFLDTEVAAILAAVDTEIAAMKAIIDLLPNAGALTTIQADLDDIQARLPAALTGAGNMKADALVVSDKTGYALATAPPTATENADAVLKRDMAAVTGEAARSLLNAIRFLRNRWSLVAIPGSLAVYKEDDTTLAWQAPVTVDPTADPVTSVDPT